MSIPKSQLSEMFSNIRKKTTWNIDGNMLWGYFFSNSTPQQLEQFAEELQKAKYHFVGIHEVMEEDGNPTGSFILHVEKIETHTVDSLFNRNKELEALADKYNLDEYDGMDVGEAPAV